jgi:hypothetical protein
MDMSLELQIEDLVSFIKELAPEVRVERENVIYEDEHANLKVYPPLTWDEDRCFELQDRIAERVVDALIDTGYLILVGVYTPQQQIELARQRSATARKQWQAADQVLRQAAVVGLAPMPAAVAA